MSLAACKGGEASSETMPAESESAATQPAPTTGTDGGTPPTTDGGAAPAAPPTDLARHKAELLTSIWENGTTVLQYGYCENIHDRRGYTSGRAGFCSGTGDAVLVARCMAAAAPGAKIARYLPALEALTAKFESSGKDQASTATLDRVGGYCADWAADASGPDGAAFRSCQDRVVDELYFGPAKAEMAKYGLTRPLTLAAIYDAEINHGDEGDDGVAALAKKATRKAGTGDESKWLAAFLEIRLTLLAGDKTWAEAVDRVALYEQLRRDGDLDLEKPIVTNAKADRLFPGRHLADSGYPSCTIASDGSVTGDPDCTNPAPDR